MSETTEQNVRMDYKDCSEQKLAEFITAVTKHGAFVRKSYVPVNDTSHFERFNYAYGKDKISIVYDTKAKRLSVTAKQLLATALNELYEGKPCSLAPPAPQQKLKISDKLRQSRARQNGDEQPANPVRKKGEKPQSHATKPSQQSATDKKPATQAPKASPHAKKPSARAQSAPKQKPSAATGATNKPTAAEATNKPAAAEATNKPAAVASSPVPEYKNGYSVKDMSKERFDAIFKAVRALKGIQTKTTSESVGKPDELVTVEIIDAQKQRVYLRYLPRKKSLSLQGKRSSIYADVQMLLTSGADFNSAIASHIKSTESEDQKSTGLERKLKKLIPSAFEYLSEQSKIDLTIGLIDIYNDTIRLSDYSVLLVPPYRGLERLIYDLQTAEGIVVKMIGQGFEKRPDGGYCLKAGYRKKINSVIYNEVLSALYTEYFTERHFLTHSDNSLDASARAIRELKDARAKFDNLLAVIDYNCKKLKEIGFSTARTSGNPPKK